MRSTPSTIPFYVASEKSTKKPPWAHVEMEAGAEQTVILHAPDPYTVMVDVGTQRSLSKPIPLKDFLTKHPSYVLNINIAYISGTDKDGNGLPGELHFNFAPPTPANAAPTASGAAAAKPDTLDFEFRPQFEEPFRVKNNLSQNIGVWLASEKSTKENSWAHLDVQPGDEGKINLKAPDKYTLVIDIGNQRGRSKSIALNSYLEKHPGYTLTINADNTLGTDSKGKALGGYNLNMIPPPDEKNDKATGPTENLDFDFSAEKQQ